MDDLVDVISQNRQGAAQMAQMIRDAITRLDASGASGETIDAARVSAAVKASLAGAAASCCALWETATGRFADEAGRIRTFLRGQHPGRGGPARCPPRR